VAGLQVGAHLFDVERLLWDEDLRGPAGDAGVGGDPARVATHDLTDKNPVVGLGGGVEAVNGIGGDLHRGVKAEAHLGGRQVIVDGLGDPNDRHALAGQAVGHPQRVVAANGHKGVDAEQVQSGHHPGGAAGDGVWVRAGGAEDGASPRQDAPAHLHAQGHDVPLHGAPPPIAQTD